jgi:high-affinity Fe2+/Pb2+ permease
MLMLAYASLALRWMMLEMRRRSTKERKEKTTVGGSDVIRLVDVIRAMDHCYLRHRKAELVAALILREGHELILLLL